MCTMSPGAVVPYSFCKFMTKNSNSSSQYQRTPCQPAMCHVTGKFAQYVPPSGQNCYDTMSEGFRANDQPGLFPEHILLHRTHPLRLRCPANGTAVWPEGGDLSCYRGSLRKGPSLDKQQVLTSVSVEISFMFTSWHSFRSSVLFKEKMVS